MFISGALNVDTLNVNHHNKTITNLSATGSTEFGDTADDNHMFVGRMTIGDTQYHQPAASLHIHNSASTATIPQEMIRLTVEDEGVDMNIGGGGPSIDFYVGETSGQGFGGLIGVIREQASDVNTDAAMVFHTATDDQVRANDREKMRITSGGNVGIGVTDPATKLEVMATSTQLLLSYDADSFATIAVADSSNTIFATGESGNLTLDAAGDIHLNADGGEIIFQDGDQTGLYIDLNDTAGDAVFKDSNNTEIFRIDTSANSLLMDSSRKIEFSDANVFIHHDGTDFKLAGDADINLVAGVDVLLDAAADIILDAAGNNITMKTGGTTALDFVINGTTDIKLDAPGDIKFDAAGNDYIFDPGGTESFRFTANGATSATIDIVGDGIIDVDGGQLNIKDGGDDHFLFDCDSTAFTIYDDTAVADYFRITVAANGATTLATNDNDGTSGDLTIDIDGDITLDADGGQVHIKDGGSNHFLFDCDNTALTIYDDTDDADYFKIQVAANGATTLTTVDNDGTSANLILAVDGDITLKPAGNNVLFHDGTTNIFNFNVDTTSFTIHDDQDTGDMFTVTVAQHGATTISTTDDDATAANLTFDIDGDIILGPAGGDVLPDADNTRNLGSEDYRWANIYTGDLHLRNERGDWTIVEEEDYLSVVNNKTGKKYKMMLQEIED
tara:strand:+ start:1845 stop:3863 length:2019 start_codon:yes stop_codon:yes gene_type:complete